MDKKDIISLGFNWIEDRGMQENNGDLFEVISKLNGFPDKITLRIWYPNHDFWRGQRIEITSYLNKSNFYLKNKEELKLLLQQLQLINW